MRAQGAVFARGLMALVLGAALGVSSGCGSGNSGGQCGASNAQCARIATDNCGKCLASCCCALVMTCIGSTSCMSVTDCIGTCASSDTVCVNSCLTSNSLGGDQFMNYALCMDANCSSVCQ